jgi:hypothetical protein
MVEVIAQARKGTGWCDSLSQESGLVSEIVSEIVSKLSTLSACIQKVSADGVLVLGYGGVPQADRAPSVSEHAN